MKASPSTSAFVYLAHRSYAIQPCLLLRMSQIGAA